MELVAEYQEILHEKRREEAGVPQGTDMNGTWEMFQESQAKVISVFAGRGTGKSRNLAIRAVRSRFDCTIVTGDRQQARAMKNMIANMLDRSWSEAVVRNGGNGYSIDTGGRVIRIEPQFAVRGMRFSGEEVMIDEFDRILTSFNYDDLRYITRQAEHVICVGTPMSAASNTAKRWFADSDMKMYIDRPHSEEGLSLLENRPSTLNRLWQTGD